MGNYRCSIIADPDGSAWDFTNRVFDYLKKREQEDLKDKKERFIQKISISLGKNYCRDISKEMEFANLLYTALTDDEESEFELNKLLVKHFRDGEFKPKIQKNIRGSNCFFIHDSNTNPSYWFTCLCLVNHALRNSSAHEIINVLPYLKFARQDVKDESRVPISAKVVAETLEHNHTRILTMDVHNPAIQGFYKIPFDSLYSFPVVVKFIKENYPEILENLVVMSPDEGGVKRARTFAKKTGISNIAIVDKYRATAGEIEDSLGILGDVSGKNVMIIDDILDSGGTLKNACKAARKRGANKVYAYCTHGLFTKGYDEIISSFDRFFIGNTIKHQSKTGLDIIQFEELFGEAIFRINKGESISALLD